VLGTRGLGGAGDFTGGAMVRKYDVSETASGRSRRGALALPRDDAA